MNTLRINLSCSYVQSRKRQNKKNKSLHIIACIFKQMQVKQTFTDITTFLPFVIIDTHKKRRKIVNI